MAHGCTVDAEAGSLPIGAAEVFLHNPLPGEQARCYRVTAVEDTLILPHSEAILAGNITDNALWKETGKSQSGPPLPILTRLPRHTGHNGIPFFSKRVGCIIGGNLLNLVRRHGSLNSLQHFALAC